MSRVVDPIRVVRGLAVGGLVGLSALLPTRSVPAAPASGAHPSVQVTARSGDVFVANLGSSAVSRFDGATGEFLGHFVPPGAHGLDRATGLAFGPDGLLYVASSGNNRILRFDGESGEFLGIFSEDERLASPFSMTFGAEGDLYVSAGGGHAVWRVDGESGELRETVAADPEMNPIGLAFAPDLSLLVANPTAGSVWRFDSSGRRLEWSPSHPIGFASDVAIGPDGLMYVSSAASGSVLRFSLDDGALVDTTFVLPPGGVPVGIAFSSDGRLIVGDFGKNRLFMARSPGTAPVLVSEEGLAGPENLTVKP